MQSAQRRNTGSTRPTPAPEGAKRTPKRRKLLPITIILAGLIGLTALGVMLVVLTGFWPPRQPQFERQPQATAQAIREAGLRVEMVGTPVRSGDQITVTVRVLNEMQVVPALIGTTTPGTSGQPRPREQAYVRYAGVKVTFYGRETSDGKPIVGAALGNVGDLEYGASKDIEVVGIGIPDYDSVEVEPSTVWTDKDSMKISPAASRRPAPR